MMSEETKIQDCEEASEAAEGNAEPDLEEESSAQLLARLQEVEVSKRPPQSKRDGDGIQPVSH